MPRATTRSPLPHPAPCDCLNHCGDDPALTGGTATPCADAIARREAARHIELVRWHSLTTGPMPDADTTVLVELAGDTEPTWLGWWDGAQWLSATTGAVFAGQVVAWAKVVRGRAKDAIEPGRIMSEAESLGWIERLRKTQSKATSPGKDDMTTADQGVFAWPAELGPLVEKLRSPWHHGDCRQAADAIERLSTELAAERERCAAICEREICACCWDDQAQAAAEHLAAEIRKA